MTKSASEWQTREVATAYLDGVRGAIPGAKLQLALIAHIARHWRPAPACVLDLGCGNGIIGRMLLDLFPAAHGVFADFSPPMLDAAREQLRDVPRASVVEADFGTPRWRDAVAPYQPFDMIVSGLAIHHQPDARKRQLYAEIHELLAPGGVFLNLEHVASRTPTGEHLFDEFFIDHLYDFHAATAPSITRRAIADTYYHRTDKKENMLTSLDRQCDWLREIGFQDVDCFFKVFELALFGGRKEARVVL